MISILIDSSLKNSENKYSISWNEAENGQEALDLILRESKKIWWDGYELVLMDLNMPILGGIETAQSIYELKLQGKVNEDLKIVAVTAFPSKTEKQKWFSVGISEFIVKPFTISHFTKLISSEDEVD